MISNEISEFYSFWSQAESREVLYWSIRYPRFHFLQKETPEMNVSESVHIVRIFFIQIDKKFPKIQLILKSWKKKLFFSGFDPTGLSTFNPPPVG